MAMKHKAEHITVFAVYRIFKLNGNVCRTFKVAYPDICMAKNWVKDICKSQSFLSESDFMVEEMSAIMKSWQT